MQTIKLFEGELKLMELLWDHEGATAKESKEVQIVFDKPFYFILTDKDGEVLFAGRVKGYRTWRKYTLVLKDTLDKWNDESVNNIHIKQL